MRGRRLLPLSMPRPASAPDQWRPQAIAVLASCRSMESSPNPRPVREPDPFAERPRQQMVGQPPPRTLRADQAARRQGGGSPRIGLDTGEGARLPRPVELVRLVAMQEVELRSALRDRAADDEPEHDEPDAQPGEARIEAGLVVGKGRPIAEGIEQGRRVSIEA